MTTSPADRTVLGIVFPPKESPVTRSPQVRDERSHTAELHQVYERVLAGSSVRRRHVEVGGGRVHLLQKGADGPPVVLLAGAGNPAGFFLPLLDELDGVHAVAADRPGVGLSDPVDLPLDAYRETAVAWLDRLLDTLGMESAALLGHSGGAVWAMWYALARPDRVNRLVLIGQPTLPGTRLPLPLRLAATPGVGTLLSRLAPPNPTSMLRFAHHVARERDALASRPDMVDLLVAAGRDPVTDRALRAEVRALGSPWALLSPSGFRRRSRTRPDELGRLAAPALVIWGEHGPLAGAAVARAATDLMPHGRLEVVPGGHAPWLGHPALIAQLTVDFIR